MTSDPKKLGSTDRFIWSLGSFIAAFSIVEVTARRAMWRFAGVSDRMAGALFSDKKVDGSIDLIRRISAAQRWKQDQKSEIEDVLDQLKALNTLRNNLLHYGAIPVSGEPDTWLITNERFVHIVGKIQRTKITPGQLDHAADDLRKINVHLGLFVWQDDELDSHDLKSYHAVLERAWLYKSPQPSRNSHKTQKTRRKQPRPPRP